MTAFDTKRDHALSARSDDRCVDGGGRSLPGGDASQYPSLVVPARPALASADTHANSILSETREALLTSLVHLRKDFWIELMSFPLVQDQWLQTLGRVAQGDLLPKGAKIFADVRSSDGVGRLLSELQPCIKEVRASHCERAVFAARQEIARRIVELPMHPEKALQWAKTIVDKSALLEVVENQSSEVDSSHRVGQGSHKSLRTECTQLQQELGGASGVIQLRVAAMLRAQEAYLAVRDEIYERHAHLAFRFVRWRQTSTGFDSDDVLQESRLGLLKAVERTPSKGQYPFHSTASVFMTGEIKDFISESGRLIRVPGEHQATLRAMSQGRADAINSRFLRVDEVAAERGLESELSEALGRLSTKYVSLGMYADTKDVADNGRVETSDPADTLIAKERKEQFYRVIRSLTKEEQLIVGLRFGLNGNEEKTLREIGEELGVSEPTAFRKVGAVLAKLQIHMAHVL